MSQLATNRPTAQHHQTLWHFVALGELVPQRVAGHITHIFQAGQGRHKGAGTGSDHDAASGEALGCAIVQSHFHRPRVHQLAVTLQHLHTQAGVTLDAVVRLNGFDHVVHALHHRLEAEARGRIAQSVVRRVAHLVRQLGAFDQRFAGHTAIVQAVATHLVRLDQRDLGLDGCGDVGADQAACAAADDDQVAVKGLGTLVGPSGVDLALLHSGHNAACDQRKDAQQHKAAQKRGAQNALH